MNLVELVQNTLDSFLYEEEVYVFWQTRQDTGTQLDEYVIYTIDGLYEDGYADNKRFLNTQTITLRYYYDKNLMATKEGRIGIYDRQLLIIEEMQKAGFGTNTDFSDSGDIDDVGYNTSLCTFLYSEVV